jgi:hypothetical protein
MTTSTIRASTSTCRRAASVSLLTIMAPPDRNPRQSATIQRLQSVRQRTVVLDVSVRCRTDQAPLLPHPPAESVKSRPIVSRPQPYGAHHRNASQIDRADSFTRDRRSQWSTTLEFTLSVIAFGSAWSRMANRTRPPNDAPIPAPFAKARLFASDDGLLIA